MWCWYFKIVASVLYSFTHSSLLFNKLLDHWKRLSDCTILPKHVWNVEKIFFSIRINSCFSTNRILLSPLLCLFVKYGLETFHNGFDSFIISWLLKYEYLLSLFRCATRLRCFLYIFISLVSLLAFSQFFNLELSMKAFLKVLFVCGFWFPLIHFFFFDVLIQCVWKNLIKIIIIC